MQEGNGRKPILASAPKQVFNPTIKHIFIPTGLLYMFLSGPELTEESSMNK